MDIRSAVEAQPNPNIVEFRPGDTVKVHFRIVEGERERIQVFTGVVIKKKNAGIGSTFTVRQVFHGVGVERTFPLHSPLLEKVEMAARGHVRRAKLYYLRGLSRRKSRLKLKQS